MIRRIESKGVIRQFVFRQVGRHENEKEFREILGGRAYVIYGVADGKAITLRGINWITPMVSIPCFERANRLMREELQSIVPDFKQVLKKAKKLARRYGERRAPITHVEHDGKIGLAKLFDMPAIYVRPAWPRQDIRESYQGWKILYEEIGESRLWGCFGFGFAGS